MSTGAYTQTGRATGPRSGFWRRFGAVFIDGILLSIVTAILIEILHGAGGYAIGVIVAVSYYTYFEGGPTGQTLGKRALGIRVIDFDSGASIGYSPRGNPVCHEHPVRADHLHRLSVDALGPREAVLARQDRELIGRARVRLSGQVSTRSGQARSANRMIASVI